MLRYLLAAALLSSTPFLASKAEAGFEICNQTGSTQNVAIAYSANSEWTSEGWWVINPNQCKTAITSDLQQRYIYYRAVQPGGDFAGSYAFCTLTDPFTITGNENCQARGYQSSRFDEIDTQNAPDFVLNLADQDTTPTTETLRPRSVQTPVQSAPVITRPEVTTPPSAPNTPLTPAPLTYGFQNGLYGDPFTQSGVFLGCDQNGCVFEIEGLRYVAQNNQGTNTQMLNTLRRWPAPVGVRLTGDLIDQNAITYGVALRSVTPVDYNYQDQNVAIQGDWVRQDNPEQALRIDGAVVTAYQNGRTLRRDWMRFTQGCEGGPDITAWERRDLNTGETWCSYVFRAAQDSLIVTNPALGNLLVYTRP